MASDMTVKKRIMEYFSNLFPISSGRDIHCKFWRRKMTSLKKSTTISSTYLFNVDFLKLSYTFFPFYLKFDLSSQLSMQHVQKNKFFLVEHLMIQLSSLKELGL